LTIEDLVERLVMLIAAALLVATGAHAQTNQIVDDASDQCWTAQDGVGSSVYLSACNGSVGQRLTAVAMPGQPRAQLLWLNDGSWSWCLAAQSPIFLASCWDKVSSPQGWDIASNGEVSTPAGMPLVFGANALFPALAMATFDTQARAPEPDYAPSGYVEVWGDEFTEANLDTTHWWTRYANPSTAQYLQGNNELEVFEEGQDGCPNHLMTGYSVKLTACPPRASDGRYPSGMLRSKEVFNFGSQTTSFLIEVCAKIPTAAGSWPADWEAAEPNHPNRVAPWPPEIDTFEDFSDPTKMHMSVKYNGAVPGPWNAVNWAVGTLPAGWSWSTEPSDPYVALPFATNAGFHIYGLQVQPGLAGTDPINPATGLPTHKITIFIDGVQTLSANYDFQMGADGTSPYMAEILLNYAVGGVGGGKPNPAQFPDAYEIKYVRVYQNHADIDGSVSTIGTNYMPSSGG
jgi:hypothetical protein